jgi:hypothetical protein
MALAQQQNNTGNANTGNESMIEKGVMFTLLYGSAAVKRAGSQTWVPLNDGEFINIQDEIKTDAICKAELTWIKDNTILRVKPDAQLKFYSSSIEISKGDAWFRVTKRNSRFEVITPTAVAGVRGTVFEVGVNPANLQTRVSVYEGKVEVTRLTKQNSIQARGRSIMLQKAQELSCNAKDFPLRPRVFSIRSRSKEWNSKSWDASSVPRKINPNLQKGSKDKTGGSDKDSLKGSNTNINRGNNKGNNNNNNNNNNNGNIRSNIKDRADNINSLPYNEQMKLLKNKKNPDESDKEPLPDTPGLPTGLLKKDVKNLPGNEKISTLLPRIPGQKGSSDSILPASNIPGLPGPAGSEDNPRFATQKEALDHLRKENINKQTLLHKSINSANPNAQGLQNNPAGNPLFPGQNNLLPGQSSLRNPLNNPGLNSSTGQGNFDGQLNSNPAFQQLTPLQRLKMLKNRSDSSISADEMSKLKQLMLRRQQAGGDTTSGSSYPDGMPPNNTPPQGSGFPFPPPPPQAPPTSSTGSN